MNIICCLNAHQIYRYFSWIESFGEIDNSISNFIWTNRWPIASDFIFPQFFSDLPFLIFTTWLLVIIYCSNFFWSNFKITKMLPDGASRDGKGVCRVMRQNTHILHYWREGGRERREDEGLCMDILTERQSSWSVYFVPHPLRQISDNLKFYTSSSLFNTTHINLSRSWNLFVCVKSELFIT